MTIKEWQSKEEQDEEYVIKVLEHKTAGSFGPARVAVSFEMYAFMEAYFYNIRKKITPQNDVYCKRFFLTNTGNEFTKISERMKDVANCFGVPVPKTGLQRKVVATEVFKSEDNPTVRRIQKHMAYKLPY